MSRNLRARVARLERARAADNTLPPLFWEVLTGGVPPESAPPETLAWINAQLDLARMDEEKSPLAIRVRGEYDLLGLPQPTSVADLDLIEEMIRLASIPVPQPSDGDN